MSLWNQLHLIGLLQFMFVAHVIGKSIIEIKLSACLIFRVNFPVTRCKAFCPQQRGLPPPLNPLLGSFFLLFCFFLFSFFLSFFSSFFLLMGWLFTTCTWSWRWQELQSFFVFFCCVFIRTKTETLPHYHVVQETKGAIPSGSDKYVWPLIMVLCLCHFFGKSTVGMHRWVTCLCLQTRIFSFGLFGT